jgi:two-component system alkaline phosphatase synthesis response regulator PhoP
MLKVLIVSPDTSHISELAKELSDNGLICTIASYNEQEEWRLSERPADLALVELDGISPDSSIWGLPEKIKNEWHSPVIALVSNPSLSYIDSANELDDFIVAPWDLTEVIARIKRIVGKGHTNVSEMIRCGDLVIDTAKFEVAVSGRPIELTFREYGLLSFLASNRGRVFTREALLNKVWGYDFYGGDRTVDVHVRRLRSKLEDANHTFIETVRNVGYRFIEDGKEC